MACGLPVLGNAGVGDVEEVLEGEGAGVVLRDFRPESMETAVEKLLTMAEDPDIRERCLEAARQFFSLDKGVRSYDRIYTDLGSKGVKKPCAA